MANDKINHPKHYTNGGRAIECIDYITSHGMGYCQGNVVKYVTRYKLKGGVEDLQKARWYIDRLIEEEVANENRKSQRRLRDRRRRGRQQNKRTGRAKARVHTRNAGKKR